MKKLLILIASLALLSCTKDSSPGIKSIDPREGSYSCLEITSSMGLNPSGNTIDTAAAPVIIDVVSTANGNYVVLINPFFSFTTNSSIGNKYNSGCPNGPCPSITFNSADSIIVYRKIANPVIKQYIGRKQ